MPFGIAIFHQQTACHFAQNLFCSHRSGAAMTFDRLADKSNGGRD